MAGNRAEDSSILATGGGGMVGSYLDERFTALSRTALDVTDMDSVMQALGVIKPRAVLHLAAATNVDACEGDPLGTYRVNALGAQNVARGCAEHKIPLVYVSTAQVFDGESDRPYHEFDAPDPKTVYGKSKLAGECAAHAAHSDTVTIRVGWMIGGGRNGEKKFIAKMLARAAETGSIAAVDDKFGSVTYAHDLLAAIDIVIGSGYRGLLHLASLGGPSRFDIACRVAQSLDLAFPVEAVSSDAFPLPAPRGMSEVLASLVLSSLGLPEPEPWEQTLDRYLAAEWC